MEKQGTWPSAELVIKARHARSRVIADAVSDWLIGAAGYAKRACNAGARRSESRSFNRAGALSSAAFIRVEMPAGLMQDVGR